ncbi:DEAD/DEAH box helicase [Sorangium sp. So ce861]|uniref:DEAD/DEAH box helicase n=1 Tax=Sorangium sp. So ce861 TaxID=3133323 RepID=UPI003F5FD214
MAGDPQPVTPGAPEAPFATRAALLAWLARHAIAHVARLNLEAVAPRVEPALWPELHVLGARRRLIDLASDDELARSLEWLPASRLRDALPPAVLGFLEDERAAAALARAAVPALLRAPDEPRAQPAHALLCALRARVPDAVAPRPERALRAAALRFDAALPGFRLDDPLPYESQRVGAGFVRPEARLTLAPGAPRAECGCGAADCVHVLAAIDAALLWLRQPPGDAFFQALDELGRPPWERTLLALDRAFDDGPGARAGVELVFRLDVVEGAGVAVAPFIHRVGKKGQRGAGARIGKKRLLLEHGAKLSAEDARIAALLPDGDAFASRVLLDALIGHPRLVLGEAPDVAVRIERTPVGLVAEERHGAVRVSAGVEGTALPPPLIERVRRARPEEVLFLWDWDQGARRLTLLDVKAEVRSLVDVLLREGNVFPPESHAALLAALARWAQRVPVAMPRSVMGESVPPALIPVLRLTAQPRGAVEVELRIRPLADGPALAPGAGARDVHVRRGEKALHAVRDLAREEGFAAALAAELPLAGAEPLEERRFHYRFASAHGALDLLAACAARDPPPELEWVGAPLRAAASRGPQALKLVIERRREWFGVLGGLSVEGERVELARLLDAARRGERYVQVEAQTYVELDGALRAHLERLSDHVHETRHGLAVGPSAAGVLWEIERAGAALDGDGAFRRLAERAAAAGELCPAVPPALGTELRPYQVDGYRWLVRLAAWGAGGVLADDMGLGKTVQALAVLLERAERGPALVLAPTSVAFNWRDEARRFAPSLRLTLYADEADRDGALARLGPGDVLVLSYGLLVRDAARLSARRFATVVFDEAQSLKNATTLRARAARALQADFTIALSGTPLENHLGELWSLFTVVFPGLLGSWDSFRDRYAAPIERHGDPAAAPALGRVLAPFLLRRTKAQVEAELPARTEVRVPVVLSGAEWQLYEDARLAALSDLETRRSVRREQQRRVEVLAALTRLRLLASHPRLYDERSSLASSKLARFLELVEELRAEGQRALVFSQFTSHLALVREALEARGVAYVYLDGETPRRARGERVREFQEGAAPLFLISLKAGGFGINLTAATNVIHLDPWWNPAVEDQASDRAHRLGQRRPVTIYRLVALGTLEEQMLSLHEQKRSLAAQVLGGKDAAGKLSTQELLGLLSARLRGPDGGEGGEAERAAGLDEDPGAGATAPAPAPA